MILFDDGKGLLAPLTDLRASFEVRTGAMTTLERWQRMREGPLAGLVVPQHLAALVRERHPTPVNTDPAGDGPAVLINGRCPLNLPEIESLEVGQCVLDSETGDLVAGYAPPAQVAGFCRGERLDLKQIATVKGALLTRPWSVRSVRDRALAEDLDLMHGWIGGAELAQGVIEIGDKGVRAQPSAKVYPGAVLDAEHGPIVLDAMSVVRPGAIVIGPVYVGPNSTVLERSTVRPNTAIGPWCKVNGEIGGTIFQGYSNKAHDGYLGDSWVGEWVNLGAGTTNSNLLNTYGEVVAVARPGGGYERTGEQFLGAVIGDHVKTAIGTLIMTGSVLHTGGMFATTAPVSGCIDRFAWCTDAGERKYRLPKFLEVMRAAMARRKIEPTAAYTTIVESLASTPATK